MYSFKIEKKAKTNYLFLVIFCIISSIILSLFIYKIILQERLNKELLDLNLERCDDLNIHRQYLKKKEDDISAKEEKKELSYDIYTDNSINKFLNSNISFKDKSYIPNNLVNIWWEYIVDSKWNQKLRLEANEALNKLGEVFYSKFNKKLLVVSAYRSYSNQKWIKDRWCSDIFCAKAWYSEHQTWLAVDLFETSTKQEFLAKKNYSTYFEWLSKNAHLYWFHNTYKKWLKIDTYLEEPWHWRYLWVDLASYLYKNNLSFAEYYNNTFKILEKE